MSYVYIESEPGLWTVGFYRGPDKEWAPVADHRTEKGAADHVTQLNGGMWLAGAFGAVTEASQRVDVTQLLDDVPIDDLIAEKDEAVELAAELTRQLAEVTAERDQLRRQVEHLRVEAGEYGGGGRLRGAGL